MSDLTLRRVDSLHWTERAGNKIEYYIIHGTDAPIGSSLESVVNYLRQNARAVSAHEVAGGKVVYQMVPDAKAAHHCGGSRLPDGSGRSRANQRSWGIEGLQIRGTPMDPVTRQTMLERVAEAMKRNGHGAGDVFTRVLGHREVDLAGKTCPGPGFDVDEFRRELVDYMAPLEQPLPSVDFAKVAWALEQSARILQGEGLENEHDYIVKGILPEIIRLRGG